MSAFLFDYRRLNEMRVYRMNESDLVCAESETEAKSFYLKTVGFDDIEIEKDFLGEVSLQDTVSDLDDDGDVVKITLGELIKSENITEPCIIASTEY